MVAVTQVSLQPITDANRAAVVALDVTPAQQNYVAGVTDSLADALGSPQAMPWYRAIYADGAPIGFVMISDNIPPGDPTLLGPYFLWRLLVDARYQGRGYGRAALDLVIAYLSTRPAAHELLTSVAPGEDSSPLGFYQHLGFQDTGEFFDGERVLRLPLR
ncbi:GNAT family N-acetyltransferase [Acrocarpospora macrocephala]|uniref:N-acetyltransferase n=1 Tax=Acrocarpospora macrocephala TaxID=150177 RepID=A0A5M3WY50_9ACTN|nr:N-acetyltransferase [Acrocarpospora macrocephala]